MSIIGKAAVAAGMGAMALAVSAPAQARGYYHHGGGDDAAIAVGAGILGLAVGAAIASSDRDDGYYYDGPRGYYSSGYYPAYPVYSGGYYYRSYPAYRAYPVYRAYPAYRGYYRDRDWRRDRHEYRREYRHHGW